MEFIKELNKKLNGKYDYLKLLKVVYNTTFSLCHLNFIYPENIPTLSDSQKQEIKLAVGEILNLKGNVECKFNKSFLDENIVKSKVKEFFESEYNSISSCVTLDDILYSRDNFAITLTLKTNETVFRFINDNDVCLNLKNYLCNNFCSDFYITTQLDNSLKFDESILEIRARDIENNIKIEPKTPRYQVSNVLKIFGSEIMPMPEYIKNLNGDKFSVILSGFVSNIEEKEYLPKKNKENGIDEKRKFYKFNLSDEDGTVQAIHFCNKSSQKHFSKLVQEGVYVLCLGNYTKNNYGAYSYSIKSMALCNKVDIQETVQEQSENLVEGYKFVKPTPYIKISQGNFLEAEKKYPDWILNKSYVVFDVETNGLDASTCDITEIGAVKIENGKIIESFQTLCKPHNPISAEITSLTGISNEMVENEKFSEELIEDFMYFSKDCVLVGYNVGFDIQFIQNSARRINKNFDNEVRDCLADAKAKVFIPNYKLGTLVKHLGITLDNAHRALFDATATAEAFLELSLL